jgi:predicted HicB family RNase H-like nuclease
MTVLQYLDYQGEVIFDEDHLVVRILHIDDFITTNVDSASQAHVAFVELVDDYIASCRELGKEPCKPFKGSFNVRMAPKLHKQVALAAAAAGQSLNAYVVQAIEDKLHANEVDAISNSVARTMAEYVMHRSQRRQEPSPWQFLDFDMPVRLHEAWEEGVQDESYHHLSVHTRFLKSWFQTHYGEEGLLSAWEAEPPAHVYGQTGGNIKRILVEPITRSGRSADR